MARDQPVLIDIAACVQLIHQQTNGGRIPWIGTWRSPWGDWTAPVQGRIFELIVSNPPYVEEGHQDLERLHLEPRMALVSGDDGFDAMRILTRDCPALLERGSALIVEHGFDQADGYASILSDHGWSDVECHKDLAGLQRVTMARQSAD